MKSSPAPSKLCDWLLNFILGLLHLHQENNVRTTTELDVPKMPHFRPNITHYHSPTGFPTREAEEILSPQMLGDHGREMP